MTLTKKFLGLACLSAAFCVGYAAAPSCSYAADEQPATAVSGGIDWTVFDVADGKDMTYYRESLAKIGQMFQGLKTQPSDEELRKLNEATPRAYAVIMKNLMNDPDGEEQEREMYFQTYVMVLAGDNNIAELEALLKAEKNENRHKILDVALFSVKLQAAAAANDKPAVQKAALELIDRVMKDDDLARQVPRYVETISSADTKLGAATFKTIVDRFAAAQDGLRQKLAQTYAAPLRFCMLVGNEMKLEGVTLEGKEFDWQSYRGKVVLVDFFATWCGPCMGEIPGMLDNYKKYRNAGFDIVSYSVDQDLQALKKFEDEKEIPWTTISGFKSISVKDEDGNPKYEEIGSYYGIDTIPRMILVGKDGKVISTNARGENLTKQLQKLFPNVK